MTLLVPRFFASSLPIQEIKIAFYNSEGLEVWFLLDSREISCNSILLVLTTDGNHLSLEQLTELIRRLSKSRHQNRCRRHGLVLFRIEIVVGTTLNAFLVEREQIGSSICFTFSSLLRSAILGWIKDSRTST